ncbi:uncharacterized protein K444DRAFT_662217 [Hyaloscypha bicolor E]|uniref:Uncharacterized protein n=1 Tax=Hyaloscypha bicolor E TaxID=1095630 RepID=A0A2J6TGF7_9HELO|nr:uncharacterized protein K444DRAFT_662217 [Hyaloscypha bicolor E]PMD62109.1 hypothetical protein K444DRAFT_662217 [Hyaloscypha bicolor E]
MTSQDSFPLPDPRLNNKIAHYDRNEVIANLHSFYNFLPHISASQIATAPPDGWPEITASSLAVHGIYKTPEALELLRYLPYISCDQPWIMITAMVCDYRRVTLSPTAREKPLWMYQVAEKQWPAWVVQLTSGTDREDHRYMLDTTDGTITMHCTGGHFEYPPTYEPDDPRGWRDRECYPETVTLKDWLEKWREEYRQTTVLAVPEDSIYDGYGSWDLFFGGLEDKPGSYNFEEMDGLRKIYREYGWPDREKYRKQACIQAIQHWYRSFMEGKRKERRIELLEFWKQRGIAPPEESNTQDTGK